MAADDSEHQPEMVKATYANGVVSYYDAAKHAHATHYNDSPVVSVVKVSNDEPQRVENDPDAPKAEPTAEALTRYPRG